MDVVDATNLDGVLFFPVTPFRRTGGAVAEDEELDGIAGGRAIAAVVVRRVVEGGADDDPGEPGLGAHEPEGSAVGDRQATARQAHRPACGQRNPADCLPGSHVGHDAPFRQPVHFHHWCTSTSRICHER
jgi:hypothetical protein